MAILSDILFLSASPDVLMNRLSRSWPVSAAAGRHHASLPPACPGIIPRDSSKIARLNAFLNERVGMRALRVQRRIRNDRTTRRGQRTITNPTWILSVVCAHNDRRFDRHASVAMLIAFGATSCPDISRSGTAASSPPGNVLYPSGTWPKIQYSAGRPRSHGKGIRPPDEPAEKGPEPEAGG